MDLQTVTVPVEEAKRMLEEYRALGDRTTDEDEVVMRALRETAKGHALIDIERVIPEGGYDEEGRPRLAIARADEFEISARRMWRRTPEGTYLDGIGDLQIIPSDSWWGARISASRRFDFGWSSFDTWPAMKKTWFAMVPPIPPALRPKANLTNYHILWEAEWRAESALPVPPRDPALLRRVTGSLFAVMAVWDLTDLERMVLGITRRQA